MEGNLCLSPPSTAPTPVQVTQLKSVKLAKSQRIFCLYYAHYFSKIVLIFTMSEYARGNGMFLLSLIRVICPPTLQHGSARFEITQELQPQTTWSLQMCIHGISSVVSVEMWVWKLSQDVYTAAFDECLLVCQRAACLTSESWLLHSSPVCSSDITHVTVFYLCCRFRCRNSEKKYHRHSSNTCWRCLYNYNIYRQSFTADRNNYNFSNITKSIWGIRNFKSLFILSVLYFLEHITSSYEQCKCSGMRPVRRMPEHLHCSIRRGWE